MMLQSTIGILAVLFTTCSNQVHDKPGGNGTASASPSYTAQKTDSHERDSLTPGKADLAKIYTQAIAEYIKTVYQKDQIHFDTLFLGKQVEFPDTGLPATISGVNIRILAPQEINVYKSGYRKSSPYINLIGFVENDQAEFIFVTFYPGFDHQYDCYINFRYNSEKKEFYPEKSRVEVLVRNNEGKPDHYAVYEDGKHVGDKPVGKQ